MRFWCAVRGVGSGVWKIGKLSVGSWGGRGVLGELLWNRGKPALYCI